MSSPEETAASAKRETLTSRAKRIIGRALDTPKETKSSGKSQPRVFRALFSQDCIPADPG
jgi:hypothetical protein